MTKPMVLLLGDISQAKESWTSLCSIAEIITPTATNRASFMSEARNGAFDGCIAVYRTLPSISLTGRFDADLLLSLPSSLRFIAHCAAGYDQIDVSACAARGIAVSHTPGAVDDSTADTAAFLILGALRNLSPSLLSLRRGEWRGRPPCGLGHDPRGKVLGVLGMGGVGRNLKAKMDAFGMRAIYHNRNKLSEEDAAGAEYVSFEELLARSDVLSLNLPLSEKTRHIISSQEFGMMKDGVVVVNTARGPVMDEDALVKALDLGKVAGAGLDVYEHEPEVHPGLVDNPNVLLLPHMGTWSCETIAKMEELCIANVRSAIEQGKLSTPVPEHKNL
ncbi:hypothetical protein ANO11243_065070 [Dothideomycetidae sp. 11243]|nr:hypothetical protein ANO11243_065070 [fungal sp. No.11243]